MTNNTIISSLFRYIVPFRFEGQWESVIGEAIKRGFQKKADKTESELYDYIRNEFLWEQEDSKKRMTCLLSLKKDGKTLFPRFLTEKKLFSTGEQLTDSDLIKITEIDLLLSRTGVGFLCFEIKIGDTALIDKTSESDERISITDIISFQNAFKELARFNKGYELWKQVSFSQRNGLEENLEGRVLKEEKIINGIVAKTNYYQKITVGQLIAQFLSFADVTFFAERKCSTYSIDEVDIPQRSGYEYSVSEFEKDSFMPSYVPDKALLFSYCSLDESEVLPEEKTIEEYAFYLATGYKESYMLSKDSKGVFFKPFGNVYWFANQEGCACLTVPDSSNRNFIGESFVSKVKSDYFILYLKCLNQSFSFLRFAERIEKEYPAEVDGCMADSEENLERLFTEINIFLTKEMATSVSHVSHQSDYYNYICDRLHINEDVNSVTAGLETINNIIDNRRDDAEASRGAKLRVVMGFISMMSVFSALLAVYEIYGFFIDLNGKIELYEHPIETIILFIFSGLIVFIGISAICYTVKSWKTIRINEKRKKKSKRRNKRKSKKERKTG